VTAPPRVTDAQRRARLVARHGLDRSCTDPVAATRAVVALHASDPATPYLAVRARVAGSTAADLQHELHEARTLWRMHAMRRTLFVVPTDEVDVFDHAVARDVAAVERRRLVGWLAAEVGAAEAAGWLRTVERRVLATIASGAELRTEDLTAAIPELATTITLGSGRWTTRSPVSSRLLFVLAMEGRIVRTRPAGSWRSSGYRWADAASWGGRAPGGDPDPSRARAELARRYLHAFGPVTVTDLRWWTGWTVARSTAALAALDATPVTLEGGHEGFVLPDDVAPPSVEDALAETARVALLPGLDPTPMGWKLRDWFLGPHAEALFDRNGNIGPTVWVDGRIVGGWGQRRDGTITHRLLEAVDAEAVALVPREVQALAAWLDGVVVTPRFRTPLERELAAD
jgi:hypothetical protein